MEILAAIKEKDLIWVESKRSPGNAMLGLKCKQYKNKVNATIRQKKGIHFENKFKNARSEIKKNTNSPPLKNFYGTKKCTKKYSYILSRFPSMATGL